MDVIRLHDLKFRTYLPGQVIKQRIAEMALTLNHDLRYENPVFIGILNGVFVFAAELLQQLQLDCEIHFVKLASYEGTQSTGTIKTVLGLNAPLKGRNVVLLEDIIDTGRTVNDFLNYLNTLQPETIRVATLLHKPDATECDLNIDYVGFRVPNEFLVGFGLDYDGLGRNLSDIYVRM